MASKEQSVTLLRRNKRAQVEALNSLGFNLTEGARAADFPMFIKWGAGLLDVTVAANRKSDNKKFFFTVEEWQSLSATEQGMFLLRGVRVRACSTAFIIAPDTLNNKVWGALDVRVPDAHSFRNHRDVFRYYHAYEDTSLIAAAYQDVNKNDIVGAPAAEAALAYKAFTLDRDGLDDISLWALPTPAHLMIMFRWLAEINAVLSAVWSSDYNLMSTSYWSCGLWETNNVYLCNMQDGSSLTVVAPNELHAVRPVCIS